MAGRGAIAPLATPLNPPLSCLSKMLQGPFSNPAITVTSSYHINYVVSLLVALDAFEQVGKSW